MAKERIAFKVVTPDMKSLGLKRNPYILKYPEDDVLFQLPQEMVEEGAQDFGGIWVKKTLSEAKRMVKYMAEEKGLAGCRIFLCLLPGRILFENKYRMKTESILPICEVILEK